MRTIKLATAYQLALTALLLGACLGTVGQRLPETFAVPIQSVQAKVALEESGGEQAGMLPTAAPTYPFALAEQRRHGEQVTPRLYLYVHDRGVQEHGLPNLLAHDGHESIQPERGGDNVGAAMANPTEQALGDYTVRVHKDGLSVPVQAKTFAGMPGYTWPRADARQRLMNLKLEFPHISAAGLWEIQLLDERGNPVGPTAHFILAPDDLNKEMYVRYERGS